ncbi:MAG: DsbA family protein [Hyphomicrobiales bacterium]|nr:DsbA family protein [Hyphomicrobiales bacterium]
MKYTPRFAFAVLFISISTALFPTSTAALDAADRPEIEKIIREYLLKNPEILGEMQEIFEARQKAEQVAKQQETLTKKAEIIYSSKYQVEIGNPDAKYKVVEFFDYNCPYCQRAMIDMKKILETNPDVKFIIKEWPVLGQQSYEAHNVSIAFSTLKPEDYYEFHQKLLSIRGRKGEKKAIEMAVSFGVDEKLLRQEMAKPYIIEALRENNLIANDLGITGTPSYVVGGEVVFGAVGFDQLSSRINALKN